MQETLFRRIVDCSLLAVLAIAPTQYAFEVVPGTFLSPVDPLVWLVCLLWIVDRLQVRALRDIRLPPFPAFAFAALAAVSILKAATPLAAAKEVFQYVEYFLVTTALVINNVRTDNAVRRVVYVLLGVSSLIIVVAAVQYFSPHRTPLDVGASFSNRNVLGGFLSLLLPLAYGMFLFANRISRRIWSGAVVLFGLVFCLAGATCIAVLLSLGLLSALKSRRTLLIFSAVVLILLLLVFPNLPRNHSQVLLDSVALYDADGTPGRRYPEWQAAVSLVREHPLFGVGAGNYQQNIGMYYGTLPDATGPNEPDIQNLYLVLAASLGLPGLIAFLAMLTMGAVAAGRGFFTSADDFRRGLSLGLLGGLLAFAVNALWAPLLVRGIGIPLAAVLALAHLPRGYPAAERGAARGLTRETTAGPSES